MEFVVVGGVAATFHGSARVTYDLDICYSRRPSNLQRLAAALAPFHPRPREFATTFTLRTDLGEIDLLAEVAGLGTYDDVKARSIALTAFERQIDALDLRSLIQAKRAAGREKDLSSLPELESLLEAQEP